MTDIIELLNAKQKVTDILLNNTGSYSGTGLSIKDDAVLVYLRDSSEHAKKKAFDLLGSNKADGHEIQFIYSGNISALACFSHTGYCRPAMGGGSIGSGEIGAGTLGVVCYDALTKEKRLLSNNHVLASSSTIQNPTATIGNTIYAPGCLDSSGCVYPIGKLNKWIPLDENSMNFVDCATAIPNNPDEVSEEIMGVGYLTGYTEPREGMRLTKSGRTTSVTSSTITDFNASIEIDYGNKIIKFTNCIVTGMNAAAGDSGSVATSDDNKAVGLLFAGSDSLTVYNRISYIMDKLNILMTTSDTPVNPSYTTGSSIEYQAQTLGIAALGTAAFIGLFPAIEQQVQLALHRKSW